MLLVCQRTIVELKNARLRQSLSVHEMPATAQLFKSSSLASVSLLWGQLSELPSQLSLLRGGGHGKSHQVKQEDKFKLSLPKISTKQQQQEALSSTFGSRIVKKVRNQVVFCFQPDLCNHRVARAHTQDGSAACPPEAAEAAAPRALTTSGRIGGGIGQCGGARRESRGSGAAG